MNRLENLRNLIFGAIVLSENLVSADELTDAVGELSRDEKLGLGTVLERRGLITAVQRSSIEARASHQLDDATRPDFTDTVSASTRQESVRSLGDAVRHDSENPPMAINPEGFDQLQDTSVEEDDGTIDLANATPVRSSSDRQDSIPDSMAGLDQDGPERLNQTVAVTSSDSSDSDQASNRRWMYELSERNPQIAAGAKIGRFRLIRQLSSGGMGIVIEAMDEDEIGRRVVVKMVNEQIFHDSATLRQMRSRLRREGEINGNLEHPNIIPVYGLGSTAEGRPFYAMRYVDQIDLHEAISNFHLGKPLLRPMRTPASREIPTLDATDSGTTETVVCPETLDSEPANPPRPPEVDRGISGMRFDRLSCEQNLAFRDLLERFANVCDAVEYAHSRNVIHRDLKPRNVMLGNHGETMVIDWGLARMIRSDSEIAGADEAMNLGEKPDFDIDSDNFVTIQGEVKGTLGYMPPEQLKGDLERLDASTDIFSLGVMLFEILTCRNPYLSVELANLSRNERISKMIESVSAPPPEAISSNPTIPRPLSAISRRAMDPDPNRRYPSAGAISAEISRWLADEPVSAYSETGFERSRRWARKHRPAVAALASTLLLSMCGVGIFAVIQTRYNADLRRRNDAVTEASARATLERNKALASAEVAKKRELLAIDAVDEFASAVTKDAELKTRRDLAPLRKKLLEEPIRFYQSLKSTGDSLDLTDNEARLSMARSAARLSALNEEIGDRAKALETYLESHALFAELAERQPEDDQAQRNLAMSFDKLGNLYRLMGNRKKAEETLGEGLKAFRMIASDPGTARPSDSKFLATLLNSLGGIDFESGRREAGKQKFLESMKILEDAVNRNPDSIDLLAMLSAARNNLGVIAFIAGNLPEASRYLEKAVETRERILAAKPGTDEVEFDLAGSLLNLGQISAQMGQFARSIDQTGKAIAKLESLTERNPAVTRYADHLSKCYNNMTSYYSSLGNSGKSIEYAEKNIAIREALAASNPKVLSFQSDLCNGLINLASLQTSKNDFEKALATYRRSEEVAAKLVAADPERPEFLTNLGNVSYNFGRLHERLRNRKEAIEQFTKSTGTFRKLLSGSGENFEAVTNLGMSLNSLAYWQEQEFQPDKAMETLNEAQALLQRLVDRTKVEGEALETLGYVHLTLADLNLHQKRFDAAVQDYEQCRTIMTRLSELAPGRKDFQQYMARCDLGIAYILAMVPGRQVDAYERAVRLVEQVRKIENPSAISSTIEALGRYRLGKFEESLAILDAAADIPVPANEEEAPDRDAVRALTLVSLAKFDDARAALELSKKKYPADRKSIDQTQRMIRLEAEMKLGMAIPPAPK